MQTILLTAFLPAVHTCFYHSGVYPEFIQSLSGVYPELVPGCCSPDSQQGNASSLAFLPGAGGFVFKQLYDAHAGLR